MSAQNRCILKRTALGNFRGETPLLHTLLCIQVLAVRSFSNHVHAAHWNVLSVSWIEFQCYDLQYLDGILFKATCDWSTLSWLFCFALTIMSIGMCFTSLALGTPHRCLYDSSNHNTKYMSALEMLSKTKGKKWPLMCLAGVEFCARFGSDGSVVRDGVRLHLFSLLWKRARPPIAPKTALFQQPAESFSVSTFICVLQCLC